MTSCSLILVLRIFQTLLGDDQYVFTRLNKVLDSMPSTDTLSHKLFPRPPSPFEGLYVLIKVLYILHYLSYKYCQHSFSVICEDSGI